MSLSLNIQAKSTDKFTVEALYPSIEQASKSTPNQLVLAVGTFDPLDEKLNFNKSKIPNKESSKYSIVQFNAGKADSQWLIDNGITVLSYMPNNAFVIIANNNSKNKLATNKHVRWQGPYLSNYRISPELWAINLKRKVKYDVMVSVFKDYPHQDITLLFKTFLPKVNIKTIFNNGYNEVILSFNNKNIDSSLVKLALIDEVQFVQILNPIKSLNSEAVSAVQSNEEPQASITNNDYIPSNSPIWDKGLFGTGQIVGLIDSGLDANEDWFVHYDNGTTVTTAITQAEDVAIINSNDANVVNILEAGTIYPDRKIIGHFVLPGAKANDEINGDEFHGTHTSGSIAGDRQEAIGTGPIGSISSPIDLGYDNDDGMAPNAQLLFQDYARRENGVNVYSSAEAIGLAFEQAYRAGVRIHSNSWGNTPSGNYSFQEVGMDRFLHEYEDMMILFAAGNGGVRVNSTSSPGNAKNVVSVGALEHGNSPSVAGFSSRGPTDDGRIKPDIMATGVDIMSAAGNEITGNVFNSPDRRLNSGTSMSTPITAGSSALIRQYFTDGFYPTGVANLADAHIPTGPLMKATLINGAGIDAGHYDGNVGWGRVFLANSILFNDSDKQLRIWEVANPNGIKTGESLTFKLSVKADQNLAVTLVWYDLPGALGGTKSLVNDLNLSVKLNNNTYKGNVFSELAVSGTGGSFDSINTVEQVRLVVPEEGLYEITVNGFNIPGDGSENSTRQGFALVATGHFDNLGSNSPAVTPVKNLSAVPIGDTDILLTWGGGVNADYFEIYKVEGTCATADFTKLRFTGNSETNSFIDSRNLPGKQYAYKIRAGQYSGLGQLASTCTDNTTPNKPQAGLYYDRGRNGHGFVVEPIANTDLYFTVFYTYKADGTPEWYTSLSTLENNVLNMNLDSGTLLRVTHDFSVDPTGAGNPNTIDTSIRINILKIDFNSESVATTDACNDGVANRKTDSLALATWQLGNQQGDWCIEPLIAQDKYPSPDFGGTWWTGIDDDGWGLSLSFSGDLIVVTIYYFDANGQPRWA